jgi:hypothetical protein
VQPDEFDPEIALNLINTIDNNVLGTLQLDTSEFGSPIIAYENDLILDFTNIESTGISGYLEISLDTSDADGDDSTDILERFNVTLGWDLSDDEFDLIIDDNDPDFVNVGFAEIEDNDDVERYVTVYGTIVEYDTDTQDNVKIMVSEEQIRGEVDILFGNNNIEENTKSIIIDIDELDDKRDELIDDGYEIVKVENLSEEDIINIKAPKIILDTQAVNKVAAQILGVNFPTLAPDSELDINEAVIRYYDGYNSILIYGYAAKDTKVAIDELLKEDNIQGEEIFISVS